MNSFLRSFYKTKNLAANGIYIIIVLIILLVAGYFLIPDFQSRSSEKQIYTLNGYITKFNDNPEIRGFFYSIKNNSSYLCIGTSESTNIKAYNYFQYLNNDPDIEGSRFSLLSGAGRTCGNFIPIFLKNREILDSLKIIYFINPVYWRKGLNKVHVKYWNRYNNYLACELTEINQEEKSLFYKPVDAYIDNLNLLEKAKYSAEYLIRTLRKKYFGDLRDHLWPEEYSKQFNYMPEKKLDILADPYYSKANLSSMDTVFNILKTFKHKNWFKPIDTSSDYRYTELLSFIRLCDKLKINTTYIIGPVNARFINAHEPGSLADYIKTVNNIREMLINENADFIDATDLSWTKGAFYDHQHHSTYGAYLLSQKIKKHLHEKDNL